MNQRETLFRLFGPGNLVWTYQNREKLEGLDLQKFTYYSHLGPDAPASSLAFGREQLQAIHTFPVFMDGFGMLVPFAVDAADVWYASEMLGDFAASGKPPTQGLEQLLATVESVWRKTQTTFLPLRWRCAFAVKLLCPVHMNVVKGRSLDLPLIVATLRAACAKRNGAALPFGNNPVFSTGALHADGSDYVFVADCLLDKLDAFIREYGRALPALLPRQAIQRLQQEDNGLELLAKVRVVPVDTLSELLAHPEFAHPLKRLSNDPVVPAEAAGALRRLEQHERDVKFEAAEALCDWLTSHDLPPYQRVHLRNLRARVANHHGNPVQAWQDLKEVQRLLRVSPAVMLGIDERIEIAATAAIVACDLAVPDGAISHLEELRPKLDDASPLRRLKVHGSLCQLYRFCGSFDEAIEAGEAAVAIAEQALPEELGRSLNYLTHAHIARARHEPGAADTDLAAAENLLDRCCTMPTEGAAPEQVKTHDLFCEALRAEICRLRGQPHAPPAHIPCGPWRHPYMFACISAARNPANDAEARLQCASEAARFARKQKAAVGGIIFDLLQPVYEIYFCALRGTAPDAAAQRLEAIIGALDSQGFPGWRKLLQPGLEQLAEGDAGGAETLCAAIPYH